jgi:hypothetical protein
MEARGVKFRRNWKLTPYQQPKAQARIEAGETQHSVGRRCNSTGDDFVTLKDIE